MGSGVIERSRVGPQRIRAGAALLCAFWCALCLAAPGAAASPASIRLPAPERLVAVGDVHGDFAALVEVLLAARIIDDEQRWIGGPTHLVSIGDLLDRGDASRAVMDLLMQLQAEAVEAGGRVHVVLGNHELMNLVGDLRYVAPGEYAAFAGDADESLRAQARETVRDARRDGAFVDERPDGFFAHRAAFAPDGRYGAWLLSQPPFVVIGDRLYIHAGASQWLADGSLAARADDIRAGLVELLTSAQAPLEAYPEYQDTDLIYLATREESELRGLPGVMRRFVEQVASIAADPAYGPEGPLWYRGNANCPVALEGPSLDRVLSSHGLKGVVIGHTPQRDARIRSRMDDRILLIDTGMLAAYYGGRPRALLIEDGALSVISPDGEQRVPARALMAVDGGLSGTEVDRLLADGTLEDSGSNGSVLVGIGHSLAVRVQRVRGRAAAHSIAAYRLDRLLGLGMVPGAGVRDVEGRGRLLEVNAGRWMPEAERQRKRIAPPGDCAPGHPFDLVRVFDALIGNGRDPDALSYRIPDLAIRLTDHGDAFPRSDRVDVPSVGDPRAIAAMLREATPERMRATLGELLDARRLDALIARRATLLERYEEA